jgi:hypothetical protein
MTKNAYIVIEVGYEYDDNYYHSRDDGGQPTNIFVDEKLANQMALDKNVEFVLNNLEYIPYYFEYVDSDKQLEAFRNAGFDVGRRSVEHAPNSITKEQVIELLNKIGMRWYNVKKVDATVNQFYRNKLGNVVE